MFNMPWQHFPWCIIHILCKPATRQTVSFWTASTSVLCSCALYCSAAPRLKCVRLQGDMGGERVLQKKWTTFLKAQLLCSLPDDGFPFNIIQDMFVLTPRPEDWKNTLFYGVFTSQWWEPLSFLIYVSSNVVISIALSLWVFKNVLIQTSKCNNSALCCRSDYMWFIRQIM